MQDNPDEPTKKEGSRDPSQLECLATIVMRFLKKSNVQTAGFNAGEWTVWFRLEEGLREPQKIQNPPAGAQSPASSPVGVICKN